MNFDQKGRIHFIYLSKIMQYNNINRKRKADNIG